MIIKPNYEGERLLTVKELAELLSLHPSSIYHWHCGKNLYPEIQRVKIGKHVYFKLSSVLALMNKA